MKTIDLFQVRKYFAAQQNKRLHNGPCYSTKAQMPRMGGGEVHFRTESVKGSLVDSNEECNPRHANIG